MGRSHERSHGSDKDKITTKGIDNYLLPDLLQEALELYPAGRSCLEKHRTSAWVALDLRAALKDMASRDRDVRYLLRLTIKSGRAKPTCFPAGYDTKRAIERWQAARRLNLKEPEGKEVLYDTRPYIQDVGRAMREDMSYITNELCSESHSRTLISAIDAIGKIITRVLVDRVLVEQILVGEHAKCEEAILLVLRKMDRRERQAAYKSLVELHVRCKAHGVNLVGGPLLKYWTEDDIRTQETRLLRNKEVLRKLRQAKASLSEMSVSEQATAGDSRDTVSIEKGSFKDSSDQRSDGKDSDDTVKSDSKGREQEGVAGQRAGCQCSTCARAELAASPEVTGLEANPAGIAVLQRDCADDHAGLENGRAG